MQLRAVVLLTPAAGVFARHLDWNVPLPEMALAPMVFALLWIVGGACAIGAAWQAGAHHRFAALILMGGAGLVTCATFVWLSALDLAVTQLLVEIATTTRFPGLRWLPKRDEEIAGDRNLPACIRCCDLLIALTCGAGMTAMALAVLLTTARRLVGGLVPRAMPMSRAAAPMSFWNVILVDFRAFDTLRRDHRSGRRGPDHRPGCPRCAALCVAP